MRCQAVGKPQPFPRSRDRPSHEIGIQPAAAGPDEKRHVPGQGIWTGTNIFFDGLSNGRDDGYDARLRSFASHSKRRAEWERARAERQSFGDPEPGAIKQEKDGKIAGPDPGSARCLRRIFGELHGVFGSCRPWQSSRTSRRARSRQVYGAPLLL